MSKVKKLQYSTFYVRYSFLTRRSCRGYNSREKARMPRSEERGGMALCVLRLIACNSKWLLHDKGIDAEIRYPQGETFAARGG